MSDDRQLSEAEIKLLISERIDKEFTDVSYAFVEKLAGRLSMFIQPKLEDRCKKCPNALSLNRKVSQLHTIVDGHCNSYHLENEHKWGILSLPKKYPLKFILVIIALALGASIPSTLISLFNLPIKLPVIQTQKK